MKQRLLWAQQRKRIKDSSQKVVGQTRWYTMTLEPVPTEEAAEYLDQHALEEEEG